LDRISFSEKSHSVNQSEIVKDPYRAGAMFTGGESAYDKCRFYLLGFYTDAASFHLHKAVFIWHKPV
jgi:hypothetical protein